MGVQGVALNEGRVAALCRLLQDDDLEVWFTAANELCRMGPGVVRPVTEFISSNIKSNPRTGMLEHGNMDIAKITPAATCAHYATLEVLELIDLLKNQSVNMREGVARQLSSIYGTKIVLATEAAGNPDWTRRTLAAWAVGFIGLDSNDGPMVTDGLFQALKDEDLRVAFVASWALGRGGAELIPELASTLKEENNPAVKGLIMMALCMYGTPGVLAMIQALKE